MAAPALTSDGWVVNASFEAAPSVICTAVDVAPVRSAPVKLIVYDPAGPTIARFVKVATPFVVETVVSAVDLPTRRVTLKGSQGNEYTFTARPEIKNLPQLKVGDKVTATFARRMVVTVRSDDAPPSQERSNTYHTARPGEKPGMLMAEETEKVARVTAIDTVNRRADLEFADGIVKSVPVRSDVDLSRYKVGDNVVIRVTSGLTVLARTP